MQVPLVRDCAVLLLVLSAAAPRTFAVDVAFSHPETYTDAGSRGYGSAGSERVLGELRAYLEHLAERHLAPGQHLAIEILDVDLAGRYEPWFGYSYGSDVRVMREITWPRIELRYSLERGGTLLARGEEAVTDMNYLQHVNGYFDTDHMRYEKRMLEDWFRRRFGERQ